MAIDYQKVVALAGRIRCFNLDTKTKTPGLKDIANATNLNMKRLGIFALSPLGVMSIGQDFQAFRDIAVWEATGELNMKPQSEQTKIDEIAKRQHELEMGFHKRDLATMEIRNRHLAKSQQEHIEILSFLADTNHFYNEGILAHYSAIILSSYTCFETLSSDLWVAAVNMRPKSLASNVVARPARNRGQVDDDGGTPLAALPFSDLRDRNFDVSKCMGELLRDRKRVSFMSLNTTKKAYLDAFLVPASKGNMQESPELIALFKGTQDVKALESIRNLFAHKGGRVDLQFREEAKGYSPELRDAPLDAVLNLDGEMIAKYAGAGIKFSVALLEFVDNWLQTHPE